MKVERKIEQMLLADACLDGKYQVWVVTLKRGIEFRATMKHGKLASIQARKPYTAGKRFVEDRLP